MHYIYRFFLSSLSLCYTILTHAQIEDSVEYVYDTVYLPADTIRQFIEIVDGIDKPRSLYKLYVGAGAGFASTSIQLRSSELSARHKQYSASAILARNSLFLSLKPALSAFSYQNDTTSRTELINYRQKTETVAVDTIYWGTPGNSTAEVIYKDVSFQQADTSFADSAIQITHNISYLTIPLGVGYRWTNKTISLTSCAGAGVTYISHKTKSAFAEPPLHRRHWLASYFCQVSASYALTETLWASIQASLSRHTSTATRTISSYSLCLGIIYEIF